MRRFVFFFNLFLLSLASININAKGIDNRLKSLYTLAGKSLNYSSLISEDQILSICSSEEKTARSRKDYENLFLIQQIAVNSHCLKGDVGLAVDKAHEMYDEAKNLNSDIGIALSIQAIAITYMHSNQFNQAYSTFEEAYQILKKTDNNFLKIRLLTQQIHTCMLMENSSDMQSHLVEVRQLVDHADIPNKQDYEFYFQCYETFYNIATKDKELAWESLGKVRKTPKDHKLDLFYYYLCTRYYDLDGAYQQALIYCDSTLNIASRNKNMNEYKSIMMEKAVLLVKSEKKEEACKIYNSAKALSDSLNMIRYSKQIDSLHVRYWTDQMAIENATMNNRFLRWLGCSATLILIFAIFLIYEATKKNKKLIKSRLKLEATRKETEASIHSKSLFLSNMSHELRTPLNAIVGFADLLSMGAVDDAESKQQFGERIKQNADLLLRLFNDVADLSALKGKNMKFVYSTCEVVALCRNVIDTVENVKKTSASLQFKTPLNSLTLYTDTGRLQQVLINLLVNATKFTPEGTITLILTKDDERNEAIFTIEDTGCGIPSEKQPHIFERFEKLHEGIQGAGLGLSICQLIVEHTGGKIWIDTDYTQGARFIFTHPLSTNNSNV